MVSSDDFEDVISRKTNDELKAEYFTFQALLAAIEPEWLDTLIFQVANEVNNAVNIEMCLRFCDISGHSES